MCTSGRINFFWGVFSAFMVYALTLISTGIFYLLLFFRLSPSKKQKIKNVDSHDQKIIINLYIYNTKIMYYDNTRKLIYILTSYDVLYQLGMSGSSIHLSVFYKHKLWLCGVLLWRYTSVIYFCVYLYIIIINILIKGM